MADDSSEKYRKQAKNFFLELILITLVAEGIILVMYMAMNVNILFILLAIIVQISASWFILLALFERVDSLVLERIEQFTSSGVN